MNSSFAKVVLTSDKPRSAQEIADKYVLPIEAAQIYEKWTGFFVDLRNVRDKIVHGPNSTETIYCTEKGFCVRPDDKTFGGFEWKSEHYYNENLVSLKPWLSHIVLGTIEGCSELLEMVRFFAKLPPEVYPGYQVRLRDPANQALLELLRASSEDQEEARQHVFWSKSEGEPVLRD